MPSSHHFTGEHFIALVTHSRAPRNYQLHGAVRRSDVKPRIIHLPTDRAGKHAKEPIGPTLVLATQCDVVSFSRAENPSAG
jgi:hypothetical protein